MIDGEHRSYGVVETIAPTLDDVERRIKASQALRRQQLNGQRRDIVRQRLADEDGQRRARNGQDAPPDERGKHGKLLDVSAIASEDGTPAAAGAKMRRVQSPVDRYHARDQITSRQAQAADNLRNDYELGICGAHDQTKGTGSGGIVGFADLQLDAATRYKRAIYALGWRLRAIVEPVVIGDSGGGEITVGDLAKSRGENEKAVMGVFRLGLDTLADHYGLA